MIQKAGQGGFPPHFISFIPVFKIKNFACLAYFILEFNIIIKQ